MNHQKKEHLARLLLRIKYELDIPIVWVEHDMKMISDLADRMAVLHYGRKIADGSPDEVMNNPQVVQAYIGTTDDAPVPA